MQPIAVSSACIHKFEILGGGGDEWRGGREEERLFRLKLVSFSTIL